MKKRIKKQGSFANFIYLCLALFLFETTLYFAQAISSRAPIYASESTQSAQIIQPQNREFKLPILIYHYVEYVTDERDTIRQSLNIEPHIFEAQIHSLKEAGYTFITPSQIEKIESGRLKIEKPIIISFDDGYRDFYTDVFPILKKHNIKAVVYVNPGLLDKLNYMYWDQLKEIARSGFVEVGSHGVTHRSLSRLDYQSAKWEIETSKSMLEKELGISVTSIAYPYGHYNQNTPQLVESLGYTSAVSTEEGSNENTENKFTFKRIHPGTSIGQTLLNRL